MPRQFAKKGFNKRTWQFRKNHPAVHTHVWEAKARIAFFDQIEQLIWKDLPQLNIVEEPEGTPPIATKEPIVKTSKRTEKVYLTTAGKVGQKCLNRPTLQTIMLKYQQDPHTTELQNPEDQGPTTRGPQRDQSDSSHIQSDGVQSVQRSQATQVYLKTKTVSTCSNYITDESDTEQFVYTVLQQVV